MKLRTSGLTVALTVACSVLGAIFLLATLADAPAANRIVGGFIGVGLVAVAGRLSLVGLQLEPMAVAVRGLTTTDLLSRADVLGLAVQPIFGNRLRRVAVVCTDGRLIPAVWTIASANNVEWARKMAWAAYGFGPTQAQVPEALTAVSLLADAPAVGEGERPIPYALPNPGLTPTTVSPVASQDASTQWLGWEMVFVVTAFALPGVAAAVELLAQHLGGVSDLNEFDLPLPHNPAASLFILLIGYASTALVVPIALLLLARTGQPPASLGLEKGKALGRDFFSAVGLLGGVWAVNLVVLIPLSLLFNNKHLTNTASNSHVPAYYVVYALFVSATTAINEEVVVNGYFMTRLSQRGWSPRSALLLSLAVRTSYHAYYGVGLIATIPFGYLVTRSFQKRGRLARPILAHFMYDAILLTIAVLTS